MTNIFFWIFLFFWWLFWRHFFLFRTKTFFMADLVTISAFVSIVFAFFSNYNAFHRIASMDIWAFLFNLSWIYEVWCCLNLHLFSELKIMTCQSWLCHVLDGAKDCIQLLMYLFECRDWTQLKTTILFECLRHEHFLVHQQTSNIKIVSR